MFGSRTVERIRIAPVPVFRLSRALDFPRPSLAREDGLLAVGGDLSLKRLLLAYSNGIFPWYSEGDPILWWSPPVRPVLNPAEVHVGRTLARLLRRKPYEITLDRAFPRVIESCAHATRPGEAGTWITEDMKTAYVALHEAGLAHSAEAWLGGALVGGLYGVSLGGVFFGESMFAKAPDASKIAFVTLCQQLARWDIPLIDSQVTNEHTARFGTVEIPREEFITRVHALISRPTRRGPWALDADL
jgi:leucyl/phenylalanyl-tRNA--protein transferase